MKILIINVVCGIGSTGRICTGLAQELEKKGHEVKVAYGRGEVPERYQKYSVKIGGRWEVYAHAFKARIFDAAGLGSRSATRRFLKWADAYDPDFIWLHNLHGYYINIELLFQWIKAHPEKEARWTLHDCWAFTGHCCHFSYIKCDKWKTGCRHCPQTRQYPSSYIVDASKKNYRRKKELFNAAPNMELQVPSKWLESLVKQSFLKEYQLNVIPNAVDDNIFRPVKSNIRSELGIGNRKMILGVASRWYRKGLSDFHKLAGLIDDRFIVVLIGLSPKQIRMLPYRIKGYPPTDKVETLVEMYSAADVCVNMSKEETFGMTTLEAIKCGTPVIVFRNTACQEIAEEYGGIAVEQDVKEVWRAIQEICLEK